MQLKHHSRLLPALLVALLVRPALADTAAAPLPTEASVLKFMQVTGMGDMVPQITASYETEMKKHVQGAPKGMFTLLHQKLDNKAITARVVAIYQKGFSQQDIDAATAFYQTPAGQHMLRLGPQLVQNAVNAARQASMEAGAATAQEYCSGHQQDKFCKKIMQAPAAQPETPGAAAPDQP